MSFKETLGRLFDWRGEACRMEFAKVWFAGLFLTILSISPLFFYFWQLFELSIDYGPDAAMMMMLEDEVGVLYFVSVAVWNWLAGVMMLAMFIATMMTTVRRLADMGWSRWCVLLASVPFVNLLFLLILFFWPGKRREADTAQ